jgi:hypothetical protein
MKSNTSPFILLFALFAANAAIAADEPVIFEDIDSDHNGAISREEAKVRMDLTTNFDEIDKNGNGSLSVDEYSTFHNMGRMVPEEVEIPEPGAAPLRR